MSRWEHIVETTDLRTGTVIQIDLTQGPDVPADERTRHRSAMDMDNPLWFPGGGPRKIEPPLMQSNIPTVRRTA